MKPQEIPTGSAAPPVASALENSSLLCSTSLVFTQRHPKLCLCPATYSYTL